MLLRTRDKVRAIEGKLSIQEKKLKRSKLQIKVMKKNIELLLQDRATKLIAVLVPSQSTRPQQPGIDLMSQLMQYSDYEAYEQ